MTASIAQKMLQRHEELVSALPADIKALIPRLNDFAGLDITVGGGRTRETTGFSAASNDLRSPGPSIALVSPGVPSPDMSENHEMTDLPRRYQTTSQANRESFAEIQQQEAEDRLAAMEQALTEARESEEAQRKAAARLRRDFEKLQRDYERAEAQAIEENLCESVSSPAKIPGKRIVSAVYLTWTCADSRFDARRFKTRRTARSVWGGESLHSPSSPLNQDLPTGRVRKSKLKALILPNRQDRWRDI
jgi:hypothetical protein